MKKHYYCLDRIEGAYAVLLAGEDKQIRVPLTDLPPDCRDGDLFSLKNGVFVFEEAATRQRRHEMYLLQNRKKSPTA